MAPCEAVPTTWKGRRAFRLANGIVEITVLLGGGHIADFRLCNSPYNTLFECPWTTIEPSQFSLEKHASQYGEGPAGRMLCGYTGHSLALGYFGMPSATEADQGLPLHGEAGTADWNILASSADADGARLRLEVTLPAYGLRAERTLELSAEALSVRIQERVVNIKQSPVDIQWVEHATFGEPLFSGDEAKLYVSAQRGRTGPPGEEGHEVLAPDRDFEWPHAPSVNDDSFDLSLPFQKDGTGLIAALLTAPGRPSAYIAVHNRRLELAAGYLFNRQQFPWVTLWEENRARTDSPWNGITRARGVEFGTSPMPFGLQQAREMKTLFDTPTFITIQSGATISTEYQLFVTQTPRDWPSIANIRKDADRLVIQSEDGQELKLPCTRGR